MILKPKIKFSVLGKKFIQTRATISLHDYRDSYSHIKSDTLKMWNFFSTEKHSKNSALYENRLRKRNFFKPLAKLMESGDSK